MTAKPNGEAALGGAAHRDVVIIGGGPAGSTLAIELAQRGIDVEIVEKDHFPREHIGESLTGEAGAILRKMGLEDFMASSGFPIKRGVRVVGKDGKNSFWVPVMLPDGAGGHSPGETWQVRRPEFDCKLLNSAREAGAIVSHGKATGVIQTHGKVTGVLVDKGTGSERRVSAKMVADASGQSTFLSRKGVCGQRNRSGYTKQAAFYGQFEGVVRDPAPDDGNTLIYYSGTNRWAWFIPLSDTLTSIGVVMPGSEYKNSGQSRRDFLVQQLKVLHPGLAERTKHADLASDVWASSNYSYEIEKFAGPGFLCVGDAHQFTDPIFSFGVSNALLEAQRAARTIVTYINGSPQDAQRALDEYMQFTAEGQARVRDLIDTFWQFPLAFLKIAHQKHKNELAELFSGRIYGESAGQLKSLTEMRRLAKISRERERGLS